MLKQALKEWQVAVTALLSGQTVMLLRKGGIRDRNGRFALKARQALLLPTYEHQRLELLKPQFVEAAASPPAQSHIVLQGWAEVTHGMLSQDVSAIARLMPWHIWNEQFIEQRLGWQPAQPLQILLLRSHRLPQPVTLNLRPEYQGCRSWITLETPVDLADSQPVLALDTYDSQVKKILAALGPNATPLELPSP